ncbi:MAG: haloacid dehalogenase-like hydrolase [Candidatus Kerfeldbacteria bacterium]|nr:haloacid dehalogenase-like hydrolase [Candidatus Kerfeldbacteria bacterium]
MLVIFDLDYTLLDSAAFKQAMRDAVKPYGISEELFNETYKRIVTAIPDQYNYDVEQHARAMARTVTARHEEISDALKSIVTRTSEFLYPDALPNLKKLDEEGHDLVIFTWGDPEWQGWK